METVARIRGYFDRVYLHRGLRDAIYMFPCEPPPLFMPTLRVKYAEGYMLGIQQRSRHK